MVARESWELLEDAKCYFRSLLRGLRRPPPPPPAFSLCLLMELLLEYALPDSSGAPLSPVFAGQPRADSLRVSEQSGAHRGGKKRSDSHFVLSFVRWGFCCCCCCL